VPEKLTALFNSSAATMYQRRVLANREVWPAPVRPAAALLLHFAFPFVVLVFFSATDAAGRTFESRVTVSPILATVVFVPLRLWICGLYFQKGTENGPIRRVGNPIGTPEPGTTPRNRFTRHPKFLLTGALLVALVIAPLALGASTAGTLGLLIIALALCGIVWAGEAFRR
jgi:hypothetical protein